MKDVADLRVTQIRLYPTDCLPVLDMRMPDNLKALKEAFRFEAVDQSGGALTCQNGTVTVEKHLVHVLSLIFEGRRITLGIRGTSKMADAVDKEIQKLLRSLDSRSKDGDYLSLVKVEETGCVATLSIDFDDLVAPGLLKYLQTATKSALETKSAVPKTIAFGSLTFVIRYSATDPQLEEHQITMSNKTLLIEPRAATPRNERRFFASSPTDSDTHLSLLRGLEKALAKSR